MSLAEHPDYDHPLLQKYLPSERRAILVHRYFLGIDLGHDPGVEAAISSWEGGVANEWRRKKMHTDRVAQMSEVDRHRLQLSSRHGREVDWEEALWDWVRYHAANWRNQWESTPAAGA
jgi:hypothetical protein